MDLKGIWPCSVQKKKKNAFFSFLRTQNDQIVFLFELNCILTRGFSNLSLSGNMPWCGNCWEFSLGPSPLPFPCKARHRRCGSGRLHPITLKVSKWFSQLLFKHLICPSGLKEKYFSKNDGVKFSVCKHLLEQTVSVHLLDNNKPKAYSSVLICGVFWYQNR